MGLLGKDAIASAVDTVYEEVSVPEWGEDARVRVKSLSASERDAFEASLVSTEGKKNRTNLVNIRAKLVAACLVNELGIRVYADPVAGANDLGQRNGAVVDRIFTVCQRLSGMSAKDIEDLEKNSLPGLSESSPSTSA